MTGADPVVSVTANRMRAHVPNESASQADRDEHTSYGDENLQHSDSLGPRPVRTALNSAVLQLLPG